MRHDPEAGGRLLDHLRMFPGIAHADLEDDLRGCERLEDARSKRVLERRALGGSTRICTPSYRHQPTGRPGISVVERNPGRATRARSWSRGPTSSEWARSTASSPSCTRSVSTNAESIGSWVNGTSRRGLRRNGRVAPFALDLHPAGQRRPDVEAAVSGGREPARRRGHEVHRCDRGSVWIKEMSDRLVLAAPRRNQQGQIEASAREAAHQRTHPQASTFSEDAGSAVDSSGPSHASRTWHATPAIRSRASPSSHAR